MCFCPNVNHHQGHRPVVELCLSSVMLTSNKCIWENSCLSFPFLCC